MKKILFILILPILLGGCYDYNELNDLALISGIGIDFKDNKYEVTFEVLSTKKQGESAGITKTYTVSAMGSNIPEAFMNNGNNLDKVPYYDHVEVVVISEDVAKNHLEDVAEYIIRSSKFRNEVYLSIAKNTSASNLLKTTSEDNPVASTFIVNLLNNSNTSSSAGYYTPFTKFLNKVLTDGEDALAPVFKTQDEKIILDGIGTFKDFKLVATFNNHDASIINLINNFKAKTVVFSKSCGDNKTVLSIYDSDIKIQAYKDYVKISGVLNGRINADACGYNMRSIDTYKTLEKEFNTIIEKEIDKIINNFKEIKSNAFSIGKIYYNKYRDKNVFLWTNQEFKYDIDLKINKKGLIFEVEDEK